MSRCGYMHVSAVPAKARRGHKIPLELEFPAVVTGLTWVVETQLRSSGRAARYRSSPHTHEFKETGRGRRKKTLLLPDHSCSNLGVLPQP